MAWNVVIAGGGFGGLYAARRLERKLPRHSARITLVTDQNFLLYTPLLPGRRGRIARAPARGRGAARGAGLGRAAPGAGHRRRPRGQQAEHQDPGRGGRDAGLRPADRVAGLGVAGAADPRPVRVRAGVQEPGRRHRPAQPGDPAPGDRRGHGGPRGAQGVPDLHLRGRGLRRPGGHRRAAGLRGRHARPVPALPHGRHPLDPGRGAGPGHARDPRQPGPVRHAGAARPRHRDPDLHPPGRGRRAHAPGCRPARRCPPGSCAGPRASSRPPWCATWACR